MISSYLVACPHSDCQWTGSLIPSAVRGGTGAKIAPMQRA
jgi:hypothetical protein